MSAHEPSATDLIAAEVLMRDTVLRKLDLEIAAVRADTDGKLAVIDAQIEALRKLK